MGRGGARRSKGGGGGDIYGTLGSGGSGSPGTPSSRSSLVFSSAGILLAGGLALVMLSRAFLAAKLEASVKRELEAGPPRHMLEAFDWPAGGASGEGHGGSGAGRGGR